MSRRKDIYKDLYAKLCETYKTPSDKRPTELQDKFLNEVLDYIEENLSLRRKHSRNKETLGEYDSKADIQ